MKHFILLLVALKVLEISPAEAKSEDQVCPVELVVSAITTDGTVEKNGKIKVGNLLGLEQKPSKGSLVRVVAFPSGAQADLKVTSSKRQAVEDENYEAALEDATESSLAKIKTENIKTKFVSLAAILVPAPLQKTALVSDFSNEDLPPSIIDKKMIKLAVKTGDEKNLFAVVKEFCCNDPKHFVDPSNCNMTCQEVWEKVNQKWIKCSSN